jgi:hypothetical protein
LFKSRATGSAWSEVYARPSVARLRIDWTPADNSVGMPAPYIFVGGYQAATQYQSPCPDPANCPAGPSTRWVEENHDSAGKARTISFVDDSTTQYVTYEFLVAHPYSGFGPDIDGTATITHADGRTFSVPFHLTASNPAKVTLGTSEGLPTPPPPRCDFEVLKAFPDFYPLLEASVDELASQWRTEQSPRLGAVWVCPTSKIVVRGGQARPPAGRRRQGRAGAQLQRDVRADQPQAEADREGTRAQAPRRLVPREGDDHRDRRHGRHRHLLAQGATAGPLRPAALTSTGSPR